MTTYLANLSWSSKRNPPKVVRLTTCNAFVYSVHIISLLLREGMSSEQVKAMRRCVVSFEGWASHHLLPTDWLTTTTTQTFISSEGHLFKSYLACLQYMRSLPEVYSDEQV